MRGASSKTAPDYAERLECGVATAFVQPQALRVFLGVPVLPTVPCTPVQKR
ncbi:MAG: hypothetical protein QOH21_1821, partial [Acidobacteriota bacterium]|nr:hypothetical protein [Acidobacteriota bacterium]